MRKPVVLITGAGGEIGHGLVTRLAGAGSLIITLDVSPLDAIAGAARDPRVHRIDHRRGAARARPRGVRSRPRLPSGGAAVDAFRVHAGHRASRQRRGDAQPARVRAAPGRVARPAGHLHLSLVDRGLRTCPISRPRRAPGAVTEDQFAHPTTMYGCNKLYCEQLGRLLRAPLQAAVGRRDRPRRLPLRPFSRPDLGDDAAVGRHLGLRARDDSRRRQRRGLRLLRPSGHHDPVHGDAGRRRRAAGAGRGAARPADPKRLQPHRLQSRRRPRSATSSSPRFRTRPSTTRWTPSGRGSSTRGRPRSTIPPRAATGASARPTISTAPSAST